MVALRVPPLPDLPSAAAAAFHRDVMPEALALLGPPRNGEVAAGTADGGDSPHEASSRDGESPHHRPSDGPPPRAGEDLVLIFGGADHRHTGWRLAAVQSLAREYTPARINAIASEDEAAISAALAYLEAADGVTGQYLPLDDAGAGAVV